MGKRLHSAVSYEVKYGEKEYFNWQADRINPIIDILAEGDTSYNDDDIQFADTISANRENLLANIDKIINPDENWEYQDDLERKIRNIGFVGLTREELHKELKTLVEQADSRIGYIHFAWY